MSHIKGVYQKAPKMETNINESTEVKMLMAAPRGRVANFYIALLIGWKYVKQNHPAGDIDYTDHNKCNPGTIL